MIETDGEKTALTGRCIYFLRTSTKKLLHEETFQREIVCGMLDASVPDNLLWNVERTMSNLFIPILHNDDIALNGTSHLLGKVKNELLPCLRSFTR